MQSVKINTKTINQIAIQNVLLMLLRRNEINQTTYNNYKNVDKFDTIFNFKENDKKFSIYIINSKLNSIISKSPLDDYLNNNINVKKFILIDQPTKRTVKQIMNNYQNCEFFFIYEFMEDIPSKIFIPKHILLSEEDKSLLLQKIKLNEFSHIKNTDTMARYYNAKVDDVFKIIRPNITTIEEIAYRIVVKGKIDDLFL